MVLLYNNWMNKRLTIKTGIFSVLLFAAIISTYCAWREDRRGILTVAFLNIGQGDAIFIDSPAGNQMIIDGGPGKAVLRELSAVMPFYDRSIDVMLATHADQDHVGGLPDVLGRYKVNLFMETSNPGPSSSFEELERIVREREANNTITKILARRGMIVDLGGGAELHVLFPDRDPIGMETNMSSIVAELVYGDNEFMLTGDSPLQIEHYLVSLEGALQGDFSGGLISRLKSDVLKPGHHGSKTSSSNEFIEAVNPEYAVISAGLKNKYGHPHQEVLDILNKYRIKILRTDRDGRIIFKTDGKDLTVK